MRNSEWFIKRFLLASRRNPDEALEMLKTTLAWRKTVAISTTPINTFPKEFFQIGGLFQYEPDLEGNPVIYMRIRMHRKIAEIQEPIQQFLFYIINKVDLETNSNGAVILFDCSGAGYANMDLDMLKILSEVAFKYFPFCIQKVIVYELSWMLNAFRRIAMAIIPSTFTRIVHFATKDDIANFIAPENLPDFMGGTCRRDYRAVPEGCPDVKSVALERGFALADVERIISVFKPYLDEAQAVIEKRKMEDEAERIASGEAEEVLEVQTEGDDELPSGDDATPVAIVRQNPLGKTSSSFEDYASLYPQNVITFRRTPLNSNPTLGEENAADHLKSNECPLTGTILLRNNHHQKALAFKVQSTNAEAYSVTPSQGVVLPGAYLCINITVKETANTNLTLTQDKFMVLLCPEVNLETDLASWRTFGRLFLAQGGKVASHKLTARVAIEEGAVKARQTAETAQVIGKLEREVGRLDAKCRRLEARQAWLNLVSLVLAILALVLVAWPLCVERPPTWTMLSSFVSSLANTGGQKSCPSSASMPLAGLKTQPPL